MDYRGEKLDDNPDKKKNLREREAIRTLIFQITLELIERQQPQGSLLQKFQPLDLVEGIKLKCQVSFLHQPPNALSSKELYRRNCLLYLLIDWQLQQIQA